MASTVWPRVVVREKQGSRGRPDLRPALPAPASTLRVESEILIGPTQKEPQFTRARARRGRRASDLSRPALIPLLSPQPRFGWLKAAVGWWRFPRQPRLPKAKKNLDSRESPTKPMFRGPASAAVPAAPGLLSPGARRCAEETRQEGKEGRAIGPCLRRQPPPWGENLHTLPSQPRKAAIHQCQDTAGAAVHRNSHFRALFPRSRPSTLRLAESGF